MVGWLTADADDIGLFWATVLVSPAGMKGCRSTVRLSHVFLTSLPANIVDEVVGDIGQIAEFQLNQRPS